MSEDESEEEEVYQFGLKKSEIEAFKNLRVLLEPYAAITEKSLELELENLEQKVDNAILLDLSKGLGEKIDEQARELERRKEKIQELSEANNEGRRKIEEEKARVAAIKNLYREEVKKRKKLIADTVPSEKELDSELEQ